jgi:hypothetical protein
MEDVLEVYQRPHDPQRPLVCLDQTSKPQSARRLADVITIDRTATAAAEIATLRQKLTAAEARIREMGQHNMIEADKRFASSKSRIPTLDDMRERMAALLRDMNNPSSDRGAVHRWLREKPSDDPAGAPSHIGPVKL